MKDFQLVVPTANIYKLQNDRNMTMLYQVTPGAVKETHYGLALARFVPFPPGLVDDASNIAQQLEAHLLKKNKTSETVLREKRRKLILNLKEHLVQAHNGILEGEVLGAWLKELQKEFVNRMTALEAEAARANEVSEDEDNDMDDVEDGEEINDERQTTRDDQPSVMSISSTKSSTVRSDSETSTIRALSHDGY